MKKIFVILFLLSSGAVMAQGDVHGRRLISDSAIYLRGTRIDSISNDTTNAAHRTKTLLTSDAVVRLIKGNNAASTPGIDTVIAADNRLTTNRTINAAGKTFAIDSSTLFLLDHAGRFDMIIDPDYRYDEFYFYDQGRRFGSTLGIYVSDTINNYAHIVMSPTRTDLSGSGNLNLGSSSLTLRASTITIPQLNSGILGLDLSHNLKIFDTINLDNTTGGKFIIYGNNFPNWGQVKYYYDGGLVTDFNSYGLYGNSNSYNFSAFRNWWMTRFDSLTNHSNSEVLTEADEGMYKYRLSGTDSSGSQSFILGEGSGDRDYLTFGYNPLHDSTYNSYQVLMGKNGMNLGVRSSGTQFSVNPNITGIHIDSTAALYLTGNVPSTTDTTWKPLVFDPATKSVKMLSNYVGGGTTPGLDAVIAANGQLTTNRTIDVNQTDLTFGNAKSYTFNIESSLGAADRSSLYFDKNSINLQYSDPASLGTAGFYGDSTEAWSTANNNGATTGNLSSMSLLLQPSFYNAVRFSMYKVGTGASELYLPYKFGTFTLPITVNGNTADASGNITINPTFQDVLTNGSTLTTDNTVNINSTHFIHFSGAPSVNGTVWVTSTGSQSGLFSENTGTGRAAMFYNKSATVPTIELSNIGTTNTNGIETAIGLNSSNPSFGVSAGFGSSILMNLNTTVAGTLRQATAINWKWDDPTNLAETSRMYFLGRNSGTIDTTFDIQHTLLRFNNNQDTVASLADVRASASGGKALSSDTDVSLNNLDNGHILYYDSDSSKFLNGYNIDRYKNHIEYFEEFYYVNKSNFDLRINGTGAAISGDISTSYNSSEKRPGVVRLITGSTSTGYAQLDQLTNVSTSTLLSLGNGEYETGVQFNALSNATDSYVFYNGFNADGRTTLPSNGIFFEYDSTNQGNYWCITSTSSGTPSRVVTTTAVAKNQWYDLKFKWNNTADTIRAYINGVEVSASSGTYPITTNIYTSDETPTTIIRKTAGTTSIIAFIDYIGFEQNLKTKRK